MSIERVWLFHVADVSSVGDNRELRVRNRGVELLSDVQWTAAIVAFSEH